MFIGKPERVIIIKIRNNVIERPDCAQAASVLKRKKYSNYLKNLLFSLDKIFTNLWMVICYVLLFLGEPPNFILRFIGDSSIPYFFFHI